MIEYCCSGARSSELLSMRGTTGSATTVGVDSTTVATVAWTLVNPLLQLLVPVLYVTATSVATVYTHSHKCGTQGHAVP